MKGIMKKLYLMVGALIFIIGVLANVSFSDNESDYKAGVDYAAQGKFDEARVQFEKVNYDHRDMDLYSAVCQVNANIQILDAIKSKKLSAEAGLHFFKGKQCNMNKDYDSALNEWNLVTEANPDFAEPYYQMGTIYIERKENFDKGIACLQKALSLNPADERLYESLALVHVQKKEYDKLTDEFDKAIKSNPKAAYSYYKKGMALTMNGKYDEAIANYNTALDFSPESPEIYNMRAVALGYKKQFEQAIADSNKAIKMNPHKASFYCMRGWIYEQNKENKKAIADFSEAINIDPTYIEAYGKRVSLYHAMGEFDEAIADATKIIELKPKNDSAYRLRAMIYINRGYQAATKLKIKKSDLDEKAALADMNKAIELAPDNPDHYDFRAAIYFDMLNMPQSAADKAKAKKLRAKDKKR